jgi:hypothetical protein
MASLHKVHLAYRMVNTGWMGPHLVIGYLHCVIKSSHTVRLIFFKPCTIVMDTLKMWMWLFWSVRTFFKKFTCTWTYHFSSKMMGGCLLIGYLLCVIKSSYTLRPTFFKPCSVVMDTLKMCMWRFESAHFSKNLHVIELA